MEPERGFPCLLLFFSMSSKGVLRGIEGLISTDIFRFSGVDGCPSSEESAGREERAPSVHVMAVLMVVLGDVSRSAVEPDCS